MCPVDKNQSGKYCGAITYKGKSCHNRAGEGTPHPGTGFCHFHEFPEGKFIHNSRKLGDTINCRSQYEKYALDKLEDDPNVLEYEYETLSVPFVFGRGSHTYIPDLLVTYSDGKRVIIEIKGNSTCKVVQMRKITRNFRQLIILLEKTGGIL